MFLERVGKLCFFKIRPRFFYFLILIPLFLAAIYLFFQSLEMSELQQRFNQSLENGQTALQRKAIQERFLERYSHADPYFLDQCIESMPLLQKEKNQIETLMAHPAVPHLDFLRERLDFISSEENRIVFTEQNIRTSKSIKEMEEKQRHPVQIDANDLQKLLSLIEDVQIGEWKPVSQLPQLLIQSFRLHRQVTPSETEVFLMEMSLVKREFAQ